MEKIEKGKYHVLLSGVPDWYAEQFRVMVSAFYGEELQIMQLPRWHEYEFAVMNFFDANDAEFFGSWICFNLEETYRVLKGEAVKPKFKTIEGGDLIDEINKVLKKL